MTDMSESKGRLNAANIAARVAATAFAVAAPVLMFTARQCIVVLPNGTEAHTLTDSDLAPFVYLVVANTMASLMEGVAIVLIVWMGSSKVSRVLVPIFDFVAPALLYSSTADAFATSEYMSYCSPHGRGRISVCTNNFCGQVHMAMNISRLAAAAAGGVSATELVNNLKLSIGGSGSASDSTPAASMGATTSIC